MERCLKRPKSLLPGVWMEQVGSWSLNLNCDTRDMLSNNWDVEVSLDTSFDRVPGNKYKALSLNPSTTHRAITIKPAWY
jgi:hypothetical protein